MYTRKSNVTAMINHKQIPKPDALRSVCSILSRRSFIGEFTNRNITQEVNASRTIEAYNKIIDTSSRFIISPLSDVMYECSVNAMINAVQKPINDAPIKAYTIA